MKKILIVLTSIIIFITFILLVSLYLEKTKYEKFKESVMKIIVTSNKEIYQKHKGSSFLLDKTEIYSGKLSDLEIDGYDGWSFTYKYDGMSKIITYNDITDGNYKVSTTNLENNNKWDIRKVK